MVNEVRRIYPSRLNKGFDSKLRVRQEIPLEGQRMDLNDVNITIKI